MMARGQFDAFKGRSETKGTISLSGIQLPLKSEFVKMLLNPGHGGDDYVHYFVCLVMYRSQVIATQMLSTLDGINRSGHLEFPNLIKINELDFDFKIYLQVYGLQTPKEKISHNDKYNIKRQEKSVFNLVTPKKNKSKFPVSVNPVNNLNIRQSKFGMVGYTTITIDTLKNKTYTLEKVPSRSPLEGSLNMRLSVHSESNVTEKGFLTYFTEVNGFGDWHRRWCVLKDNTLFFWKYPEDEQKRKAPIEAESISLHDCISDTVTLAPRDICARMNTFMLENRRSYQAGDKEAEHMHVDKKHGLTTIRNLLVADTRDERLNWCKVLNTALENLRAWDPTSMRPRSASISSSEAASDSVSNASTDIW
jgi:actin-binding protein anillin